MAIQINVNETNFNDNIVSGFASSSGVIDGQGMVMSNAELEKMVTKFMIKYKMNEATIDANHSIKNVGYIIESQILKTDDDRRKWWLSVKLINEDVINKIKQSGISGMSISGNAKETAHEDGVLDLTDIDLTEVSVLFPDVDVGEPNRPANPEAIPTMVKRLNNLVQICKSLFKKENDNMDNELKKSIDELTKSIEGIPAMVDEKISNRLTEFDKSLAERFIEKAKKADEEEEDKEKEKKEKEDEEEEKKKKSLENEELKKKLAEQDAKIAELTKAHETEVSDIKKALDASVQKSQQEKPPATDTRTPFQKVYDANKALNEKTGLK